MASSQNVVYDSDGFYDCDDGQSEHSIEFRDDVSDLEAELSELLFKRVDALHRQKELQDQLDLLNTAFVYDSDGFMDGDDGMSEHSFDFRSDDEEVEPDVKFKGETKVVFDQDGFYDFEDEQDDESVHFADDEHEELDTVSTSSKLSNIGVKFITPDMIHGMSKTTSA